MVEGMFGAIEQAQVLGRVVEFVPIYMVNDLVGAEFPAEQALHHQTVFVDAPAVNVDDPVPLRAYRPFSVRGLFADEGVPVPHESEIVAVAESFASHGQGAPSYGTQIFPSVFLEPAGLRISLHAVHELPSFHAYSIQQTAMAWNRDNGENRVNSGEALTGDAEGNPEPSRVNGTEVARKVQRLGGEEPTNKPPTSARPERDDIVHSSWKHEVQRYVTDCDGVGVTLSPARAASAGAAVAGIAAETIAAGAYGLCQVYGYHAAVRVRNITGGSPAAATGSPLALNAAGSVWCLENWDTGSTNIQVITCGFLLEGYSSWTSTTKKAFIKAL